jgi:hypothetical protein
MPHTQYDLSGCDKSNINILACWESLLGVLSPLAFKACGTAVGNGVSALKLPQCTLQTCHLGVHACQPLFATVDLKLSWMVQWCLWAWVLSLLSVCVGLTGLVCPSLSGGDCCHHDMSQVTLFWHELFSHTNTTATPQNAL